MQFGAQVLPVQMVWVQTIRYLDAGGLGGGRVMTTGFGIVSAFFF